MVIQGIRKFFVFFLITERVWPAPSEFISYDLFDVKI